MSSTLKTVSGGVTLSLGLFNVTVNVAGALEPVPTNTTVCNGGPANAHIAQKISTHIACPSCGPIERSSTRRAREVGDNLIVLDESALESFAADATPFKKAMTLTGHPAPAVEIGTTTGDKLYYLIPLKGPQERAYAVLTALIRNHPEYAFCTRWAPRSKVGMYRVTTRDVPDGPAVMVMQERLPADRIKAAPDLPVEADEQLLTLAETVLRQGRKTLVTPYVAADYADDTEDKVAGLLDGAQESVPGVDATLAALQAMVAQTKRVRPPRPRRAADNTPDTSPDPDAAPMDAVA